MLILLSICVNLVIISFTYMVSCGDHDVVLEMNVCTKSKPLNTRNCMCGCVGFMCACRHYERTG